MKKLILTTLALFFFVFKCIPDTEKTKKPIENPTEKRLLARVSEVETFISKTSKYNDKIGFFIDMKIPSGKNRFFVYDFKQNKIIDKGLVAHGIGSETGMEGELKFSNINNSQSSSLGKYYVGKSYYGQFGKAYKLYGLDTTNSKAYDRNIVLHKYFKVPYNEQAESICNSYGCPMVNEKYFERIESILDNSEKNVILDIYY